MEPKIKRDGEGAKTREADENVVANLKAEPAHAQQTATSLERQLSILPPFANRVMISRYSSYFVFAVFYLNSDVENVE